MSGGHPFLPHSTQPERPHNTLQAPSRGLEGAGLEQGCCAAGGRRLYLASGPTILASPLHHASTKTNHILIHHAHPTPYTPNTQPATQRRTMADDKNNKEAKEASPFANTTFSFTAPQGGVSAPFPNLAGFSQALAAAAQGAQEEDDEPLAPEVQARIDYLKKLQGDRDVLMKAFHEERKALVKKYEKLSAPLLDKRRAILLGDADVTKKEEDWEVVEKEGVEEGEVKEAGVPHFWLQAIVNHSMLRGMIEEDDVPALKFVTDIQNVDKEDGTGFTLNFHFAPNPYFANAVLSKSYVVPNLLEEEEAMLESTGGTVINWTSAKKNLCVEEKKMKPKGKSRGGVVVKQVKKDSFFHWFEAVEIPESPEAVDEEEYEELMERLDVDYAVAAILREEIVPEAIKWYLGEGEEDESEYGDSEEESEEEESEEESESDEESSDEEPPPQPAGGRRPRQAGRPRRGGR